MAVKQVLVRNNETGHEALVPETSLGHWAGIGWVPVEDELSRDELAAEAQARGVTVPRRARKHEIAEAVAAAEQPNTP